LNKRNDKRKRKKRPLIKLEWQKWSPAVKSPPRTLIGGAGEDDEAAD
jgi:hypothetical protein